MDNDPKHRSSLVTDFLDEEQISYWPKSEWPAQSPDMNPMENVWAMLLDGINRKPVTSVATLKKRLKDEWKKLPQTKIASAINSMPTRLEAVKKAKGGSTKY